MSNLVIKVENLGKQYRLGAVGTGTLSHDLNRWWQRLRGKEDPYLKIGEINDRSTKGDSNYVWALKEINFDVKQGEVLGIIGKNGAGKSTLLKILSRTTSPTTGCFKAKGRIASLLEVGTGFHPELTGRENVFLNGAILGMSKVEIKSKFDEIVAFSGVERYIDTPVKRYSSGMYVRLAFAVAAHLEPEILIIDEVLAVGDAEFQKKCMGKMKDVSGQGRTVLFVSHNMGAIKNLCNRVIYLKHGLLHDSGNTQATISKYLSDNIALNGEVKFEFNKTLPAQIMGIAMKNEAGQANAQFKCGESFHIEVDYAVDDSSNDAQMSLGIGIADNMDFNIYSDISSAFKAKDSTNIIYINKNTVLAPGNYLLTVNLFYNGKSVDYKEKVLNFEVLEITANNVEYNLKKGEGAVITNGIFNIK